MLKGIFNIFNKEPEIIILEDAIKEPTPDFSHPMKIIESSENEEEN